MLTRTLTAALCASAAAALALEAGSDIHVDIGDTVNTSVSNDYDIMEGVDITYTASDYFGCWFADPAKTSKTFYGTGKFYIRSDMNWYSEAKDSIKPWGWNKNFILAEDPDGHYGHWNLARG